MELHEILKRGRNADDCGWLLAQHDLSGLTTLEVLAALHKTCAHPWDSYREAWSMAHAAEVLHSFEQYRRSDD